MNVLEQSAYHAVLKTIRQWPYATRLKLVQDILKSLETGANLSTRQTFTQALGLLAQDRPPPSDAEIDRWLDEHRLEKYG